VTQQGPAGFETVANTQTDPPGGSTGPVPAIALCLTYVQTLTES